MCGINFRGADISSIMNQTAQAKPPDVNRPWWVRFALYGLPNRGSALASMWLLIWIAVLCVLYGFRDLRFSLGAACVVPLFLWYLKAIQWVDQHGGWPAKRRS
jgi:hypothetical protein